MSVTYWRHNVSAIGQKGPEAIVYISVVYLLVFFVKVLQRVRRVTDKES